MKHKISIEKYDEREYEDKRIVNSEFIKEGGL